MLTFLIDTVLSLYAIYSWKIEIRKEEIIEDIKKGRKQRWLFINEKSKV